MPNNFLKRSQPQNWFSPFRKTNTKLTSDEILASLLHFKVRLIEKNEIAQTIFMVVRKGNKAVARNIIFHGMADEGCQGHADDIAEYPIEDIKDLINEVKEHSVMMATKLAKGGDPELEMEGDPTLYMEVPINATREEIVEHLLEDTDPMGKEIKNEIIQILGLDQNNKEVSAIPSKEEVEQMVKIAAEKNEAKAVTNLAKAALEMDLIKKYGKKQMEELAKKMKYKGEVINKSKSTAHVN